jgi:2-iminoacetate synthase
LGNFSQHFASVEARLAALAAEAAPCRSIESVISAAEDRGWLELEEAAGLLEMGRDPAARSEIESAARELRRRCNNSPVEFIIPEYLTSFCQNDCLYCGYRKTNPLAERVRLSLAHFEQELDVILAWGHRQIELVLADDAEFTPSHLAPFVELTRRKLDSLGGGLVALNAPAYEGEDYRRLHAAGLDWVALWQETYDRTHFNRWHVAGTPKRQFEFRLDVWDRAIPAGFRRVALGVLFGLYDWRFDVLALLEHGNYLLRTYGIEPYALGVPRLKPARGVLASQKPSKFSVSDEDYRLAVAIYHLAFPRSHVFFNTRETYEFNLSMLAPGDLFTVDCETLPGAYLRGRLPGQFATHAYPRRRDVVRELRSRGFAVLHLAGERDDQRRAASAQFAAEPFDHARWMRERYEVRMRLLAFADVLAGLESVRLADLARTAAVLEDRLAALRDLLMAVSRSEEESLFPRAARLLDPETLEHFRREHENFAVDLDRFERQIASYRQSGDPTVLLTLGRRMIGELRRHLQSEESLLEGWLRAGTRPNLEAECV